MEKADVTMHNSHSIGIIRYTRFFQHVDASGEGYKLSVSVDKTEVKRGDIITYSIDFRK